VAVFSGFSSLVLRVVVKTQLNSTQLNSCFSSPEFAFWPDQFPKICVLARPEMELGGEVCG
jgi:hypothetical protein